MTTLRLSKSHYTLLGLLLVGLFAFLEFGGFAPAPGTLLITLVFWSALLQGAVAVAAVTDLVGARWIASLRRELLAATPLLFLFPLLFLLLGLRLEIYPWSGHPGAWLNAPFFLGRNVLLLFAVALAAGRFARLSLAGDPRRSAAAVLYLFAFVASQTLVAFDWVMSLAWPWVSTLLGAYFFVEALYGGLALAGLLFFLLRRSKVDLPPLGETHMRDLALLTFGFSILWAGLFFAQYLLLWYGNLPEEVGYILDRLATPGRLLLCALFLAGLFLVPFLALLSRRAKQTPAALLLVALAVLTGLFAERALLILPAAPPHLGLLLVENGLLLGIWLAAVANHDLLLPQGTEKGD